VLSLLLKSQAKKKALVIGGGVANFTDVKTTFRGVIRAMEEEKNELSKQKVMVFVRRGGPNQNVGLSLMKKFLESANLYGNVVGPDVMITEIITQAVKHIG
jgi:ATP citrate (pro-S)-lyase